MGTFLIILIVIYCVIAVIAGPLWIIDMLGGKAGPIGIALGILLIVLFIIDSAIFYKR